MPFEFFPQKIKDVILIKPVIFDDERGFFMETYKKADFINNGINDTFLQDNCSVSKKGVLRGLHFQKPPYEQAKLITCLKGTIYDVAVDIRPTSSTFGQYIKVELSDKNNSLLYIPKGFAHGFVVLSEEAKVSYKVSDNYCPNSEDGIIWNDKELKIDWGIDFQPILSEKDKTRQTFSKFKGTQIL